MVIKTAIATDIVISGTLSEGSSLFEALESATKVLCSPLPIEGLTEAMGLPKDFDIMVTQLDENAIARIKYVSPRVNDWVPSAPDIRLGEGFLLTYPDGLNLLQTLVLPTDSVVPEVIFELDPQRTLRGGERNARFTHPRITRELQALVQDALMKKAAE